GLEFGAARRFAARAGIAAFAVFNHFGGALEHPDLAQPGDITAIPFDAEFEILVRVESLCIDAKLCHGIPPRSGLNRYLAGHLLNLDDHELGGLERRKTDDDVDDP